MSSKNGRFRTYVIGLASALAAVLFFSVPTTDARFVASESVGMTVGTPRFGMELLDQDGISQLRLDYSALAPGVSGVDYFVVKNIGQIDGRVKFTGFDLGAGALRGMSVEQANMLTMSIDGYQDTVPVAALDRHIDLGILRAGQSRVYALRVGLERGAGSEWRYRALSLGGIDVALVQR